MAKKKKLTYWERRAVDQEVKVNEGLIPIEKKVIKAYNDSNNYLTKEVKKIYNRYLDKSSYSESDVKTILNTTIPGSQITELSVLVKTIENPIFKKRTQDYLTGLAVKSRITRLEELKAKSYIVSKQIADVQLKNQKDYYIDVIQEAYNQGTAEAIMGKIEKSYRLIDDGKYPTYTFNSDKLDNGYRVIDDGKYPTYTFDNGKSYIEIVDGESGEITRKINITNDVSVKEFKELSTKQVRDVLETRWLGSNYSERIWKDTDLLANKLQEMFSVEALTGMSESEMAKQLQKQFNVSSGIARRLIRTEANYMANQSKLKAWEKNGIKKYRVVAVLDLKTSKKCQHEDGKIYNIKDAKVGFNYPPYHPWCRTVVVAQFENPALSIARTGINPITREAFKLQGTANYKAWEKEITSQIGKKDLALQKKKVINFNQDNLQFKRYKKRLDVEKDGVPRNLAEFQEIKYNEKVEYERLKRLFRLSNGTN